MENISKDVEICLNKNNNYYNDYIRAVKLEIDDILSDNPYSIEKVKIYTYLDCLMQKELVETDVKEIENLDKIKIVINNKNNGVIAFCGKNSNLKRCPASTVKPWLIYAPMIEEKYITESSIINDSEININGYSPKNYGGKTYGNTTIKDALKLSLNIPTVKLLDGFQIKNVNKYTQKMGVNITNEGLSCALGSINGGMTLKEICDTYSVFNNDGNYQKSSFVKKVFVNGNEIYNNSPSKINVYSSETAYIINDMLSEARINGTSKKLKDFKFDLCAKTGTNGDNLGNLDAYSISYTKNHIVGVWIGKENGEKMSANVSGGGYPTIINREILNCIYKNSTPENFNIPNNIVKSTLNKEILTKNMEYRYDENGETFYYILGTEPKTIKNDTSKDFKCNSTTINILGNTVTIKNSCDNCENLEILRNFKGTFKTVYNGKYLNEFIDNLDEYGIYEYTLIFTDKMGNNHEYKLSSINFNKLDITSKDWWDY